MKLLITGLNPHTKGGTENLVFNYIEHFHQNALEIDVVFYKPCAYLDEIKHLPIACHVVAFDALETFFVGNDYDYIWHHSSLNKRFKELELAKQYGIPRRILHSHMSRPEASSIKQHLRALLRKFRTSCLVTDYWSCSEISKMLFLKSKHAATKILPNAIPLAAYRYNDHERTVLRRHFSESDLVIGHIARLCDQKNQAFLISVFEGVHALIPNAHLVIVGAGPDEAKLRQLVAQKGLADYVHFMGWQAQPARYYNAFDMFLLPSLHEGLPLSVLEAQVNGLPVLISTEACDSHLNITGLVHHLSLKDNLDKWATGVVELLAQKVNRCAPALEKSFSNRHFDVADHAKHLEDYFLTGSGNPFI